MVSKTTDTSRITEQEVWSILEKVKDPEVPVLSIIDLGVLRGVQLDASGKLTITITPTYSGCPAMDTISMDIRLKLMEYGIREVQIIQQLSPAWTTDWMTEGGKKKLRAYGIAPPNPKQQVCHQELFATEAIQCPHCNSWHTELISQFGSTACKALYRCTDCREAFDYFKCH
ncbi:ring-1,2-phenylacetyl-CoA epoxidase subunit PaaD [Cnuella takakiae]|uniref:Ring-1,2-phenylacetyl-CoA epoxidase subunit PaaD n=1 Tax=Cnuella takakiae TaxID=1302690 RepID=A0A1M5H8Y4_9BACT|nr:1,2-phenylacetyl-CoA epoxidase subunit PaaD [Cnuella takakiae]SHG12358.1 ring-1,2-phenylacetyl-CoA epoxidase subunit PaaD [Cnuella takakiae]